MVDFVNVKKKVITLLPSLFFAAVCMGAVPVHINSGNPAYPFPQFLEYACGGNLGTKSPEGVTHAEMEHFIRKAYQQHALEFTYTGEEHEGIKYIELAEPFYAEFSESDGYGLLAAAYMADKPTFDGYWMCTHDKRRVRTKRYKDCTDNVPDYRFGEFTIAGISPKDGNGGSYDSAADGDVDIALALYVAYKQWGEFMRNDKGEIVRDACGEPISYKQELINVIRGLVKASVDSTLSPLGNPLRVITGLIGLDGYVKGGNTLGELTNWASQEGNYIQMDGVNIIPAFAGGVQQHTDYCAPAYYREFHDLLDSLSSELGETNAWEAEQFRRGEASSDWLIGDLIGKSDKALPTSGNHTVNKNGDTTSYSSFNTGEDFRTPWRTISNYVWHGNPAYSWNPVTHQVVNGSNSHEYDAAVRLSDFMRDPAHWTDKSVCVTPASPAPCNIPYTGPRAMPLLNNPITGEPVDFYGRHDCMQQGASVFAAIGVQDYDLMGDLYNVIYENMLIEGKSDDGQLIPKYMRGWFRQMGLMALTGNYAAPSQMNPKANLKIYKAVKDSMSYCHTGDTVTYLLSFRNYGSVDAQNVVIVDTIPAGFDFLNADLDGVYDAATHTVKWSLSKLAGFKSDGMEGASIDFSAPNLSKTIGQVSYRCVAKNGAKGRYHSTAEISCSNGSGSKTNDYPNYVTATMQRNHIDVIPNGISLSKTVDVSELSKGDVATFSVNISMDSVPCLTGGRSGVNVTMAKTMESNYQLIMRARLYNDAVEPYIDNGNYRITFFKDLKDVVELRKIIGDLHGTQNGRAKCDNVDEFVFATDTLSDSTYMFTLQFPHTLATSMGYLEQMWDDDYFSCEGTRAPLDFEFGFSVVSPSLEGFDWNSGFSQLLKDENNAEGAYYPISPSFQTSGVSQPVTRYIRSACDEVSDVTETVLVEEFDGYVWRKILGDSPLRNGGLLTLTDTVPLGFEFVSFTDENTSATYHPAEGKPYAGIVTYSLSQDSSSQVSLSYKCRCVANSGQLVWRGSHASDNYASVNSAPSSTTFKLKDVPMEGDPVTVHINSGNPAYPFPQFLEYACGGNLGTNVPEGVSHAEMEKYIREAYQLHANEFAYTGEVYEGIKYIWTPDKNAYDCTEGDGYALLAAAYMADKPTFDGYWMCTHDKRRVHTKRYMDCTDNVPDTHYGDLILSDNNPETSAADGDVDVALALYVAYKQWGEFMRNDKGEIVKDACGEPISYKQEMINVIRGLVAMGFNPMHLLSENPRRVTTGMIGLDGYVKGGNTWNELTKWASQDMNYIQMDSVYIIPEYAGGVQQHTDYCAPAYYREFHDLLDSLSSELGETNAWETEQFRRGEASSDWLIGDLISKNEKALPTAGWHTVNNNGDTTSYSPFDASEDFRTPWRTISNYVWHGSPAYSWNPVTHQVESKTNTYEYDAAVRLSDYMRDPAHWTSENSCVTYGNSNLSVTGPKTLSLQIDPMTGAASTVGLYSLLVRQKGAFSFAAIGGQDYDLMGDLFGAIYESCDVAEESRDGRIVPRYMEGWFRQLGLMALTGNYAAPSQMKAQPNLKIYRAVKDSVSYCHVGDTVTYLLSYRNYGSVDAQNVLIEESVPDGFIFLDADNGGKYDAATHTVAWSLSKLAGFKSDDMEGASIDYSAPNLSKTIGQVSYRCVAKEGAKGRYQASAEISCANGLGSKTDSYPNYITATMQRNAIDVIPTNIAVAKAADVTEVAMGDLVTFNVSLSNDTVPALTGGRTGVNVALAEKKDKTMSTLMMRLYNDALEPIDYGNYRITVFNGKYRTIPADLIFGDTSRSVNLNYMIGVAEGLQNAASEGKSDSGLVFKDEMLADSSFMRTIQFPHVQAASTTFLSSHFGLSSPLYDGPRSPMRVVINTNDARYNDIDWGTGFSQIPQDEQNGNYYPVTPSYQSSEEPQPVDRLMKSACEEVSKFTENVLVEEFDGYTWRKILGNSPLKGVVAKSVTVTDTIPLGFEFVKFLDENTTATYQPASATANPRPNGRGESSFRALPDGAKNYSGIVTYTLNSMNTGEKNSFSYLCRVVATESDTIRCVSHVSSDKESVNSAPLVLYVKEATSLPSVEAESPYVDVYNMLGIMLKKQVLREKALDGLMPGVYVVGDQKMVKAVKD